MRGLLARSRRPIVVVVAILAALTLFAPSASAVKRNVAKLSLNPAKHTFMSLAVGKASAPFTFTVTNNGAARSGPVSFATGGTNGGDFLAVSGATNGCVSGTTTLAVGASCSIAVTFQPASVGKRAAILNVSGGAGEGTPFATLAGSATAGAHLTISPTDNDFGTVTVGNTSSTATFTVTNDGAVTSGTIHDHIIGTDTTEFTIPYQTNNCDLVTLAPGASCTIGVYFGPTSSGAKSASVQAYANTNEGAPSATLEGTGQEAAPACTVGPNSGCITLTSVVLHYLTSAPGTNPPTYGTKTYTISGTMSFTPTCQDGTSGCDYSYPNWVVTGSGTFQVDDGATNIDVGTWTTELYPTPLGPFADSSFNASTCHDAAIRSIYARLDFTGTSSSWIVDYAQIRTDTTASGPFKNMMLLSGVEGDGNYHTSDVSGISITCSARAGVFCSFFPNVSLRSRSRSVARGRGPVV